METQILDGKRLSKSIQSRLHSKLSSLIEKSNKRPCLAVCLVGEDPASQVYVRNKHRLAHEIGIESIVQEFSADISQSKLIDNIQKLNNNPDIHGILLQLPLPSDLDEGACIQAISPEKDVDGLTFENLGRVMAGEDGLKPCTPFGIMTLLHEYQIPIRSQKALVIGRSRLVGRPIAEMLLSESATVSIAHSQTDPLQLIEMVKSSDIVVSAVGKPHFVKGEWIKPGATLIDVGINRIVAEDGQKPQLVGDICYDECLGVAGAITPVPGGIGPLTVSHLMINTIRAFELSQ